MPNYEYECRDCGKTFELFQSMSDKPLKKCIRCGGRAKRLIGLGGGIIFKGSGFYATDYRSHSYKEGKKKDAPPSSSECGEKKECKSCPANPEGK